MKSFEFINTIFAAAREPVKRHSSGSCQMEKSQETVEELHRGEWAGMRMREFARGFQRAGKIA
jgi:hypothetical protein